MTPVTPSDFRSFLGATRHVIPFIYNDRSRNAHIVEITLQNTPKWKFNSEKDPWKAMMILNKSPFPVGFRKNFRGFSGC